MTHFAQHNEASNPFAALVNEPSNRATATDSTALVLIKGADNLNAAIKAVQETGQTYQKSVHQLAVSILYHVGEHGDTTVVKRFIEAMPESTRSNGLRAWFEHFGPVKFDRDAPSGTEVVQFVRGKPALIGDADAKPFWKFKAHEGKPYEALDMEKWLTSVIKKLEKDAKEAHRDHSGLINDLTARLTGLKNTEVHQPAH